MLETISQIKKDNKERSSTWQLIASIWGSYTFLHLHFLFDYKNNFQGKSTLIPLHRQKDDMIYTLLCRSSGRVFFSCAELCIVRFLVTTYIHVRPSVSFSRWIRWPENPLIVLWCHRIIVLLLIVLWYQYITICCTDFTLHTNKHIKHVHMHQKCIIGVEINYTVELHNTYCVSDISF